MHTVFSAESNAKPVIAWAVMRLVDKGLVQLDSPVEAGLKHFRLPPSVFDHKEVTVRRILTHTSGLSWGRMKDFAEGQLMPSVEKLLASEDSLGQRLEVEAEPGTRFNYSSGGYAMLQLLVEDVSGQSFSDFVRDEVLHPLGILDTGFSPDWPSVPSYDGFGRIESPKNDATANDLRTSLHDLTVFALAHFDGPGFERGRGVLLPSTVSMMLEPSAEADNRRSPGYRLKVSEDGDVVAGHDGGGSMFRVSTNTGDGLVLVSNSNAYMVVPRIECEWERWRNGDPEPCSVPAAHALYGSYQTGGVNGALEQLASLKANAPDGYLVDDSQIALFAHLLLGAEFPEDAARVFEVLALSSARGDAYAEAAASLRRGETFDSGLLACYAGEFHSSSGDTLTLELQDESLVLDIEGLPWRNSVLPISRRIFAYNPFGSDGDTPGQIIFDLDGSGHVQSLSLSDPDLDIYFSATRVSQVEHCPR